jgi:hypothetical protein
MDAKEQRRKKDREQHARMTDEEKQEKLKKIAVKPISKTKQNKEANKRNMTSKESIAMVNPAYIATQQEGGTSTLNVRQRNHVTPGERQTLLHRRSEEFSAKQRKTRSVSSQQDTAVINSHNASIEPLQQPQVMINGNILNFIQYIYIQKTCVYL